jgi:ArsR family transcriptional regulator
MDKANLELAFKALSDPTRLKILEILKRPGKSSCGLIGKGERGLCACDIQEVIGLSQAATSYHMELLKRAGLIYGEKRERWMFYWRNEAAIALLAETIAKSV